MPKAVEFPLVGKDGWAREVSEQFPTSPALINPEVVSLVRQSNARADWAVIEITGEQSYHIAMSVEEVLEKLGFEVEKQAPRPKPQKE